MAIKRRSTDRHSGRAQREPNAHPSYAPAGWLASSVVRFDVSARPTPRPPARLDTLTTRFRQAGVPLRQARPGRNQVVTRCGPGAGSGSRVPSSTATLTASPSPRRAGRRFEPADSSNRKPCRCRPDRPSGTSGTGGFGSRAGPTGANTNRSGRVSAAVVIESPGPMFGTIPA